MSAESTINRDEIGALLVFLANGTLEGEERRIVEEAVGSDPALAAELAALKALRDEMQAGDLPRSPGEFGLARLMREVRDEEDQAPAARSTVASPLWRIAAAVALGLLALQTVWVSTTRDPDATLAGGEETAPAFEHTLRVAFVPTATETEIRELLLSLGLVIVDGPSAIGLFTLAADSADARAAALRALQAAPAIVESAE